MVAVCKNLFGIRGIVMIKVLVAEDELPLLRGIANMIEELDSEFEVVMRAKNGKEALLFIDEEPVDIVFTDINMPMMDGLELLQYLSENHPDIATVVISGYDEFSYVQQAIRYRSKNYLLKPVSRMELKQQLSDMKEEIKAHSYKAQEEFLTKLLFGNETFKAVSFAGQLYPLCLCAGASILLGSVESRFSNEYWGGVSVRALLYEIRNSKEGVFCYLGRNSNEMLLLLEEEDGSVIASIAEKLLAALPGEFPVNLVYKDTQVAAEELKKVMYSFSERIYREGTYGQSCIVNLEAKGKEFLLSDAQENALRFCAGKSNGEDMKGLLAQLCGKMKEYRISQSKLEQLLPRLVNDMMPDEVKSQQGEAVMVQDTLELLRESASLEQFFEDFYLLWQGTCFGHKFENGRELMHEVDDYITEHVKDNITTKELSHKFGLVSPYLSKLFKEYKGETPTQYIQNIRIQCAKEMLKQYPGMLAKDVAELVGYGNPLYFSKIFKKKVGVYPSEYREGKKDKEKEL